MEIIFTSNKMSSADTLGYLYACHHDGSLVSGWPQRTHGFTYMNGATIADIDGDDSMDIIAVSAEGSVMQVSIWEAGVPFNRNSWEWQTYHYNMARTGLYQSMASGINEPELNEPQVNARIFPNLLHAGSAINITLQNSGNTTIDLFDITGKLISNMYKGYLGNGIHKFRLPLNLTNGIYFIQQTQDDVMSNYKLILQK
jgi:hypothetical protein